jgi:metal-sulfur cluster biosynthetic enzyme|tara:strand:+ start:176 stop:469 length:294 start_codon:yes stop_codon:yes gene_type:complete
MLQEVMEQLKTISDPEIPIDIVELGLIYDVSFDKTKCNIVMTLTTAWCPVAQEMPIWVKEAALKVEGVDECDVAVTFDPPWGHDNISEAGKLELGLT